MREIRPLHRPELDQLLHWAAQEGWNPGVADASAFWAADPEGFLGAFVDDTMVAAIAAVAYDDQFGFIGLYLCRPQSRGQGHGRAVWDAAMHRLWDRTIGLDAVAAQRANYQRMGFQPAYETVRMSGTLPPAAGQDASVRQIHDVASVTALDRMCFPAQRRAFLQHWTAQPHTSLMANDGASVSGYLVCRPCRAGQKIGPLFARDQAIAESLLQALEGPVQIDVPVSQTGFLQTLERRGFLAGLATTRMYRGREPDMRLDQVFGISSLELG